MTFGVLAKSFALIPLMDCDRHENFLHELLIDIATRVITQILGKNGATHRSHWQDLYFNIFRFCSQGLKGDPGPAGPLGPVGPKGNKVSESAVPISSGTLIFFLTFAHLDSCGFFGESAWHSRVVIPAAITGLPTGLKCCFDCYSKHGWRKSAVIAFIAWRDCWRSYRVILILA